MKKKEQKNSNVTKGIIAILIAAVIGLICLIIFMPKNQQTIMVTDPTPIQNEISQEHVDGQVDLPMVDSFTVDANNQYKTLKNPSSNAGIYTVEYQFYKEGDTTPFFTSDKIESGYEYAVNFFELVDEGETKCNVIVQPYKVETGEACNNLSVAITITKN